MVTFVIKVSETSNHLKNVAMSHCSEQLIPQEGIGVPRSVCWLRPLVSCRCQCVWGGEVCVLTFKMCCSHVSAD